MERDGPKAVQGVAPGLDSHYNENQERDSCNNNYHDHGSAVTMLEHVRLPPFLLSLSFPQSPGRSRGFMFQYLFLQRDSQLPLLRSP